jgi:tetratricopeptide (TPR) repeat protein
VSREQSPDLERQVERALENTRLTERLLELAATGGSVAELVDSELGEIPLNEPLGGTLKDAIEHARAAAKAGDSGESVSALAALAERASAVGLLEVAAVICAEARNLATELGLNADASDLANLENVTGLLALHVEHLAAAERAFSAGAVLARDSGAVDLLGATLLNLCNVRLIQQQRDEARRFALESLAAYREAEDREGQAKLLLTLVSIALDQGDLAGAEGTLEDAASLISKLRNPGLTASRHALLGQCLVTRENLSEAEREFQKALAAARRSGDLLKEASVLQSLAAVAHDRGFPTLAHRRLISATNFAASHNLIGHLRVLLGSLARAEHHAGNAVATLRYANQALELSQATGLGLVEAKALLGAALVDNDRPEEALEVLRGALPPSVDGVQASEIPMEELGRTLHNFVVAHRQMGTIDEAEPEVRNFLRLLPQRFQAELLELIAIGLHSAGLNPERATELLVESVGLRPAGERAWACLVSAAQLDGGKGATAQRLLEIALASANAEGQEYLVVQARNDLALAVAATGATDRAISLLETNAAAAESINDRISLQLASHNLAETYRRVGRAEDAEREARQSVDLAQQLGDSHALAGAYVQLGLVLSDAAQFEEARLSLEAAQETAPEGKSVVAMALSGLAGIALGEGRLDDAVKLYRRSLSSDRDDAVHTLERLLGLCEALAAVGNRRSFNVCLQQVVDLAQKEPLGERLYFGLPRSARRWADQGRLRIAGEVLAVVALMGALDWSKNEGATEEVDGESHLVLGMVAIAQELDRQASRGMKSETTRRAIESELARHLDTETLALLMDLLETAVAAATGSEEPDADG